LGEPVAAPANESQSCRSRATTRNTEGRDRTAPSSLPTPRTDRRFSFTRHYDGRSA
jgi:hypothetical protein